MNSLWIKRISNYTHSDLALASAKNIIAHKIQRQHALLKKYNVNLEIYSNDLIAISTKQDLFLHEARIAHMYWQNFRQLLHNESSFHTRVPRSTETVNRLLDIGYHHITNKVKKNFESRDMSCALGILHTAQSSKASPLAYDFVELFRSDLVDTEVLKFFRQKKKIVTTLNGRDISHFLHKINLRMNKMYYLRTFHACRSYAYYMQLQILSFSRVVREKNVFIPIILLNRHEDRCKIHPLDKNPKNR